MFNKLLAAYILIKKHLMMINHADEQIIKYAHLAHITRSSYLRTEYIRTHSYCNVIRIHPVILFLIHDIRKEFNVKLESIEAQNWNMVQKEFDVEEHDLINLFLMIHDHGTVR